MRRKSRGEIPKLKDKLWKVFTKYIKERDNYACFTCGKHVEGRDAQGGHFIPKAAGGIALYFDERNVHCQCSRCNCALGGNQYIYGQRLGKEVAEELERIRVQVTEKWTKQDYLDKIEYYEQKLQEMQQRI